MTDEERRDYNHTTDPNKEVDWEKWEHVLKDFQPKGGEQHGKNSARLQ